MPGHRMGRNEEIDHAMKLWNAKSRRRIARHLERPSKIVKVICAVPGILLAMEIGFGGMALLNNGRETVTTGLATVHTCSRNPLTGWVMYRCDLEDANGKPIDTGIYQVDTLKAFRPPHGRIVYEIRKTPGAKGTTSYIAVEMGTSRHSFFLLLLVVPLVFAAYIAMQVALSRLLRLTATAVRPQSN
ncbi:hypothetical protein GCM10022254_06540 [Actinomadura meridiana]|uniref:DUF3592 domain-containing protein n=2 Tax=Actinomadura meridiana TaxID=559626 RepID=A0ABP8BU85_9ACTN